MKRCTLIAFEGRITGDVAPEMGSSLRDIMQGGQHHIVVNLVNVNYLSSAGVRELIAVWKACRRRNRGDLRVVVPRNSDHGAYNSMELVGLVELITIFETDAEAVGSF